VLAEVGICLWLCCLELELSAWKKNAGMLGKAESRREAVIGHQPKSQQFVLAFAAEEGALQQSDR
jgi:hypothetical protein